MEHGAYPGGQPASAQRDPPGCRRTSIIRSSSHRTLGDAHVPVRRTDSRTVAASSSARWRRPRCWPSACSACSGDDDQPPRTSLRSPSPRTRPKASTALEAGLEAHAAGDLETATLRYDETLSFDEGNKFALYNLALIDEASGNYGLAEDKYRAALDSDPAYQPALFNLAILRTGRDPEEALELYRAAVESEPDDAAAWLNLGLLLRASGEKKEGDDAVRQAITLNPDLVDLRPLPRRARSPDQQGGRPQRGDRHMRLA